MSKKATRWPTAKSWWKERTSDQIAEEFGVHRNTVSRHRTRHNLPSPPRRGGPGRTPKVDRSKIRLDRTAEWNARKQDCSENWMFQLMSAMRKAQNGQKPGRGRQPDPEGDFWS